MPFKLVLRNICTFHSP